METMNRNFKSYDNLSKLCEEHQIILTSSTSSKRINTHTLDLVDINLRNAVASCFNIINRNNLTPGSDKSIEEILEKLLPKNDGTRYSNEEISKIKDIMRSLNCYTYTQLKHIFLGIMTGEHTYKEVVLCGLTTKECIKVYYPEDIPKDLLITIEKLYFNQINQC